MSMFSAIHSFDAEEICKISIPESNAEDRIAWHYERNGIFTVRSAYKLVASIQGQTQRIPSSSSSEPNARSIWDLIWKAKVPPKVRIFGWRVATNTLATKRNKWKRTLEVDATCGICGCDEEDEFHAVVACTKSRALRYEMRKEWELPPECSFRYTGPDWLQVLLDKISEDMQARVLMLLWRGWHLRDNCIHGKGNETIRQSVAFLLKYEEDLQLANATSEASVTGKAVRSLSSPGPRRTDQTILRWTAPPQETVKINSDATFLPDSGQCWAGAVARDYRGLVFVSACEQIGIAGSVEEAEARAALVGLKALAEVYRGPIVLEMDCLAIVNYLNRDSQSLSPCYGVLRDSLDILAAFTSFSVRHVNRKCNTLAHELAVEARQHGDLHLIARVPDRLMTMMQDECTPST